MEVPWSRADIGDEIQERLRDINRFAESLAGMTLEAATASVESEGHYVEVASGASSFVLRPERIRVWVDERRSRPQSSRWMNVLI
jgi:hypothetical protein